LIEAIITLAAWEAIERLSGRTHSGPSARKLTLALATATAAALLAGVFFASGSPDVLEYFQEQSGIATQGAPFPALMPDYEWARFNSEWLRKSAAGMAGLLCVFGLSLLISRFVPRDQQ
jgi:uncharacterized membrane protein YphA (DoxX/SURF4 family)